MSATHTILKIFVLNLSILFCIGFADNLVSFKEMFYKLFVLKKYPGGNFYFKSKCVAKICNIINVAKIQ